MRKKVNIQRDVTSREAIQNRLVPEVKQVTVIETPKEETVQDDKGEIDKEPATDPQPEPKEQKKANGKTKRNT